MAVLFGGAVDALACSADDTPLIAVGTSCFTGRWWNGAVTVLEASDVQISQVSRSATAEVASGVPCVTWKPSAQPESGLLYCGSDAGQILCWKVGPSLKGPSKWSLQSLSTHTAHHDVVSAFTWLEGGRCLASASWDGQMCVWEAGETLRLMGSRSTCVGRISGMEAEPGGVGAVAVVGHRPCLEISAPSSDLPGLRVRLKLPGSSLQWVGQNHLLVGDISGSVALYDTREPTIPVVQQAVHSDAVTCISEFSDVEGCSTVATGSDDGGVGLLDINPAVGTITVGRQLHPHFPGAFVRSVCTVKSTGLLMTGGWDQRLVCNKLE